MNAVLINLDFYQDAQAAGIPIPPKSAYHSTSDKLFVDGEHEHFAELLRMAVLRYTAGCRRAKKAMKWLAVQITQQDREKLLKKFNDPSLLAKNPSFSAAY
jgi:hypothetical protein